MDCQNRESFKAFPGVRINVSDTGISTTVSAASLRMSLNARGFARPEELEDHKAHHMPCVVAGEPEDPGLGRPVTPPSGVQE